MKYQIERPGFRRGMPVVVDEQGIANWRGRAMTLKPSPKTGWWFEVEREDGVTLVIHSLKVKEEG